MIAYWVGLVVGAVCAFVVYTAGDLGWRWWVPYAINCPLAAGVSVVVRALL